MSYTSAQIITKANNIASTMKSYENHNIYSQSNRYNIKTHNTGSGDCSSAVWTAYKAVLNINIGANTVAQITNANLKDVDLDIINGVPDESKMRPGDLLYFRGTDTTRAYAKYVGHVEMYVGNGELSGHGGPGIGPTRKNMKSYCTMMQNSAIGGVTPANRGLICVRRATVLFGDIEISAVSESAEYFPKYTGSTISIVMALKAIGCKDTSIEYRTTIAEVNGIVNYRGTAEQNTKLVTLLKAGTLKKPSNKDAVKIEYFGRYTGSTISIVMALKAIGCKDTSIEYRTTIAEVNGIVNYRGTAEQNTKLVTLLKAGTLKKPN